MSTTTPATWTDAVQGPLQDLAAPFDVHLKAFKAAFGPYDPTAAMPPVWEPRPELVAATHAHAVMTERGLEDWDAFWQWSVEDRDAFWQMVLDRLAIPFATPPWALRSPDGTPEAPGWLPGARLNIALACFQAPSDRVAIRTRSETDHEGMHEVTYGELRALTDRFAHGLRAAGVAPGEAVALYMPMDVACVAAYLGTVLAGCAVVSIADSFAPKEVANRIRLGGAVRIVTVSSFLRAGKTVDLYAKVREAGAPPAIVIPRAGEAVQLRDGDVLWEDFLGPDGPFEAHIAAPDEVTNILFSSGTTGDPKAIPWTHLTPIKAAMDGHFHQDIHADDVVAWPTNIGWMMGPWLIYATLMGGATMALYEGAPHSTGFLDFVHDAGVTILGVVPALVRAWRQKAPTTDRLAKVRVFSSTGEASTFPDYLWLMSRSRYRAPVIEYCGGTEIGGGHITGTLLKPACPTTFTTPALGLRFLLLDEEGAPIEEGAMGELYLVPPSIGLSERLLNRDHHEAYYAGCPPGPDGEVLRRHGDEVQSLPGGGWTAQGRADDTMNLGGIKVSSIELERVMDGHPAVQECAAVAVPPPGGGPDRLVVFVVEAGTPLDREELRRELQARIKETLNPLFRIHDVVPVESLPRTASNKVMRRALRARYAA